MNKVEEIMELVKAHDIKELKDYFNKKEEAEKRNNTIIWIFCCHIIHKTCSCIFQCL